MEFITPQYSYVIFPALCSLSCLIFSWHFSHVMNSAELSSKEYTFMSMLKDCSSSLHYVKSFPLVSINETYLWTKYVSKSRCKFHTNFLSLLTSDYGNIPELCKFQFPPEIFDSLTIAEGHSTLLKVHYLISLGCPLTWASYQILMRVFIFQ